MSESSAGTQPDPPTALIATCHGITARSGCRATPGSEMDPLEVTIEIGPKRADLQGAAREPTRDPNRHTCVCPRCLRCVGKWCQAELVDTAAGRPSVSSGRDWSTCTSAWRPIQQQD